MLLLFVCMAAFVDISHQGDVEALSRHNISTIRTFVLTNKFTQFLYNLLNTKQKFKAKKHNLNRHSTETVGGSCSYTKY